MHASTRRGGARFSTLEGIKRTYPWIKAQAVGGRAREVGRCSYLAFGLGAGGFGDEWPQRRFLATVDDSASPRTCASCVMETLLTDAGYGEHDTHFVGAKQRVV